MPVYLMVPIHLDALWLDNDLSVVEGMADFSRLPYSDRQGDIHPDVAHISEEILSTPFQDQGLQLKKGIHLHWALPDALTRGRSENGRISFPAVPNRWLVTRRRNEGVDQRWVVESDYLFPPGASLEPGANGSISYPYADATHPQPFRRMGRQLPLVAWQNAVGDPGQAATYLPLLTAVGYGEPNFASFYPNCHSVFGFYDANPPEQSETLSYDVVGWYDDPAQDVIASLMDSASGPEEPNGAGWLKSLQTAFGWTIAGAASDDAGAVGPPTRLLCYARLAFSPDADHQAFPALNQMPHIAVGNSSTEALAAYLASQLDHSSVVEDQLEALHLVAGLTHQRLDVGFKFREARHEKEFAAVPAGSLWTIRPDSPTNGGANAADAPDQSQASLSDRLGHLLNRLNLEQQAYDKALAEIEAMRKQLFADWYKYMLSAYPPEDTRDAYPDIGRVRSFIERYGLFPLKQKLAKLGGLMIIADQRIGAIAGAQARGAASTLAAGLAVAINETLAALPEIQLLVSSDIRDWEGFQTKLREHLGQLLPDGIQPLLDHSFLLEEDQTQIINAVNDALKDPGFSVQPPFTQLTLAAEGTALLARRADWTVAEQWRCHRLLLEALFPEHIARRPAYRLQQVPAPRYWRPNNPVVLVAGDVARSTERHGEDGRLHRDGWLVCQPISLDGPVDSQIDRISVAIDRLNPPQGVERIGFSTWQEPPWHPIILEWEVELFPTRPLLFRTALSSGAELDDNLLPEHVRQAFELNGNPLSDEYSVSIRVKGAEWLLIDGDPQRRSYILKADGAQLDVFERNLYGPNHITAAYQLAENDVDLTFRPAKGVVTRGANVYVGRSILTPHAKIQLKNQIADYIEKLALEDFYPLASLPASAEETYLPDLENWYKETYPLSVTAIDDWKRVETWYERKPLYAEEGEHLLFSSLSDDEKQRDPIYTAIRAYGKVKDLQLLAQSLGGFNEALLMHKQTLQLPIADPLGFPEDQPFTREVAAAVQRGNRSAPQPLNDFNPIRTGVMKLLKLRLVDTFGRTQDLDCDQVIGTDVLTTSGQPHLISLPPRLAQPARLNFRWLAADSGSFRDDDEPEMNAHPATTPICGWLLPNNLDQSLMVYDQAGQALGSINQTGRWSHAPGRPPLAPWEILNSHLRRLVNYLLDQEGDFIATFLTAIERGLENIDPENFGQHQALALLMGRPIAVVRAALELELLGPPAIHQGWHAFRQDMARNFAAADPTEVMRETGHFTQVKFPIRLGEYQQLNDGLIGYWLEDGSGNYKDHRFYAPQTPADTATLGINHDRIVLHRPDQPLNISQALADPPRKLTMLVDPRGAVHATCGILPTKAIHIPPDQFTRALQAIEVTFLSAPILSARDESNTIKLTLPAEADYAWSWLEKENGAWSDASPIAPFSLQATFEPGQALREGWLKLKRKEEDA